MRQYNLLLSLTSKQPTTQKLLEETIKEVHGVDTDKSDLQKKEKRPKHYNSTILEEHGEDESFELTEKLINSSLAK